MRDDRHGRALRADNERSRRPSDGYRVRDIRRFGQVVEDAVGSLPAPLLEAIDEAELVVEEIPPPDAESEEEPLLAAFRPAQGRERARVVVYRRPLELRALSRAELGELVRLAVGREVAVALGLEADFDDWWEDEG